MNETQRKALLLLGLARKARKLEIGEEPCGIACRSGKAKLLLIAHDAGDHTCRRARSYCRAGKPPYLCVPFRIFSYPVQRHRWPEIFSRSCSRVYRFPLFTSSTPVSTSPGVQKPHWIAASSTNAC